MVALRCPHVPEATQRPALQVGSAAIFYTAVTIVLTWPLALRLSSALPVTVQDPLLSASILWWNAHVMPLTHRWWDGFAFFPVSGTIAFSDHRLGESLLATPLQWAGLGAVTAHNVTLLATFPLCALAAHWLAFTVTRRHDAAVMAGLAFGFSPYRMARLEHLELLAAFGMPAALAALHVYVQTPRRAWLLVFGAMVAVQAWCTSYYALFFCVVLALWIPWFQRWRDRRAIAAMLVAWGAGLATVTPIAAGYWRIHHEYGLVRMLPEVRVFSAGLNSFVTASPMMALWGWTAGQSQMERQLFPGATVLLLALAGVWWHRRAPASRDRWTRLTLTLVLISMACTVAGMLTGGAALLSVALATLIAGVVCHPAVRASYAQRSPYAFYAIAAVIFYLCCLGPTPTFAGRQVLHVAPYALLMRLPVFADDVRVPARFAMPAVLMLSMAAALAFDALPIAARARRRLAILIVVGLLADGWIRALPLAPVPEPWPAVETAGLKAVLSLPLGDPVPDTIAMYRATLLGLRSVNGYSGFYPPSYDLLEQALSDRDGTALDALARNGPLLVAVDKDADIGHRWADFVGARSGVTPLGGDVHWAMFRLAAPVE